MKFQWRLCPLLAAYCHRLHAGDPELLARIIHPEDRERFASHREHFADPAELQMEFRILTKDGQIRWIAHGCRPAIKDGKPHGRRVSNRDITDLKIAEQLAQKLAYFDALTGLPNRRLLQDRLEQAVSAASRQARPMALMFLDLDKFKQINDTFGHDVGDQLLIEVARRFAGCTRTCDTVSRTGGDEFVILLPSMKRSEDALRVAKKLLAALNSPIQCGSHAFVVSVSIGIAVLEPGGADNATELMKKADVAMYRGKQAGGNCYRLFVADSLPQ